MPQHVGQHYTGTSCLCDCHFTKHACDDEVCRKVGKSEAKRLAAQDSTPVVAAAAEPFIPMMTPFGPTTRFGR
jgi:hypothetical protein